MLQLRNAAKLPDDHPDLQNARRHLLWGHAQMGNTKDAAGLALALARGVRRGTTGLVLPPRHLLALAERSLFAVEALCSLVAGVGTVDPRPDLAADALLLVESLRGLEVRALRTARRRMSVANRVAAESLSARLMEITSRITLLSQGRVDEERSRSSERERKRLAAIEERDGLQAQLLGLVDQSQGVRADRITTQALGKALAEGEAAVSIVAYLHRTFDSQHPGFGTGQARVLALCLERGGRVKPVPLGARSEIDALVGSLREEQAAATASRGGPVRRGSAVAPKSVASPASALGLAVMGPILEALPGVHTMYLSVDETLQLVPLDALPVGGGRPLGEQVSLRSLSSLLDLLDSTQSDRKGTGLVAFGGVDYGQSDDPRAEHPREELVASETEVNAITAAFQDAFPEAPVHLRLGQAATKEEFLAFASHARYLHVATHGFFAPALVDNDIDREAPDRWMLVESLGLSALSPHVLCGLVFATPRGSAAVGTKSIATGEEIMQMDLGGCEIAVLAACDTSLGVRQAGQGHASLRKALQAAGARYVVTSLWQVDDHATRALMVDFYEQLWSGRPPNEALWRARMHARALGGSYANWAGWVLTGL